MDLGFLLSWLVNFFIVAIVLALVDEHRKYYLETQPWFLFAVAVILPTACEIVSYLASGEPFLALILPDKWWAWLFAS